MKKSIKYLSVMCIILILLLFSISVSWSDSGWDTDYGTSSSSNNSNSSSSSRSSSNNSNSSSSSRSSNDYYNNHSSKDSSTGSYTGTSREETPLEKLAIILQFICCFNILIYLFVSGEVETVKGILLFVLSLALMFLPLIHPIISIIVSIIVFIIIIVLMVPFIIEMVQFLKDKISSMVDKMAENKRLWIDRKSDVSVESLQSCLPFYTLDSLKDELYQKFLSIQKAWMNFDYDVLKKECTDELYNTYHSQLEVLSMKKQKNIMSDFKLIGSRITNVNKSADFITVGIAMQVSFYDYVVSGDKVVAGSKNKKITNCYNMTFILSNHKEDIKCPNCGAKLEIYEERVCRYCKSKVVIPPKQFVLSKKVNEKTIK